MEKKLLIFAGAFGAVGGAIAALCLSFFRTLPALAIGGMIGAGAFAALVAFLAVVAYCEKQPLNKNDIPPYFVICINSTAIGAGLAVALTYISPEIFTKWNTAIVAGIAIGAIGIIGGVLALEFFMGKPEKKSEEERSKLLTELCAKLERTKLRSAGPQL